MDFFQHVTRLPLPAGQAFSELIDSQQRELMEKIRGTEFKAADKLRLALLYALRYEDTADISSLKRELLDAGVSQQKVQLIDAILSKN